MAGTRVQITTDTYEGAAAGPLLDVVAPLYAEIYAEAPYREGPDDVADFARSWPGHLATGGFRLVVASEDGSPVGFAFGLELPPDTGWWSGALDPLGEVAREWPRRTFAVIELAVRARHRRRGAGRLLHDDLLAGVGTERVTLLVRPEPEAAPARAAYASWGYRGVGRIRPGPSLPVYEAMVLDRRHRRAHVRADEFGAPVPSSAVTNPLKAKEPPMPTRETAPTGAPCWVDLMTSDQARSRAFYCELFGWEAEEPNPEFGGYFNFTRAGVRTAGCMASQSGMGVPDVWTVYLATDDAAKTVEAATAHGGAVHVGAMPIAEMGSMALVADPAGAAIGVWQPGTHPGFLTYSEPGAPGWFELHTRAYERAVDFYRDVFGWETHVVSDTPEFRYTTLVNGEEWLAGIMDASAMLAEGVGDHWSVYFAVDDTDAALAQTVALGGAVVMPAEDSPYGRLAVATDATGAQFKLVGPNDAMPG